jgi:hypothetical protein
VLERRSSEIHSRSSFAQLNLNRRISTMIAYATITTTRTFNTKAKVNRVIDLYLGLTTGNVRSMDFIAKKYGVAIPTVRNVLTLNGVAIRGRGRVAQNA